jgi:hypothetical protein
MMPRLSSGLILNPSHASDGEHTSRLFYSKFLPQLIFHGSPTLNSRKEAPIR